jgi:hypothetical protein
LGLTIGHEDEVLLNRKPRPKKGRASKPYVLKLCRFKFCMTPVG